MAAVLTEQQHRAVHTRGVSVVLSSGAGCGKTHVLTERYLAHLRDGADVGQVVAITFTDRAAREMRRRIRHTVLDHMRLAEGEEAEVWSRHLRELETAPISTIHAFSAALLRRHAVEAGLDPRFDVLEEVLSVNLHADALALALRQLLTGQSEAGEDLRQLVLLYGWRVVVDGVDHLTRVRDERAWLEWLGRPADWVAQGWAEHARDEVLPRLLGEFAACPVVAQVLLLLRDHPPQPGPMSEAAVLILDELPRLW
jgi:ATP-dependent helicase/nuclease subunit A